MAQQNQVTLEHVLRHIDEALIERDGIAILRIAETIKENLEGNDAELAILYFERGFQTMYGKDSFKEAYEDFMMMCKGRPEYQIDIMKFPSTDADEQRG
jgi:hypothetical protein